MKVGQIYKEISTSNKWVVTRIFVMLRSHIGLCLINQKGEVTFGYIPDCFFEKVKLIAEYPTWQEAVNSKEFNNQDAVENFKDFYHLQDIEKVGEK